MHGLFVQEECQHYRDQESVMRFLHRKSRKEDTSLATAEAALKVCQQEDLKRQLAAALGQNKVCIPFAYCACSEILSFPLALYSLELGWWA